MSAARRPFLLSALGAGLGLAGSALLATGACVPPELISEVGATSTEGGTAGSTSAGGAGAGGSGAGSTTGGAGSGGATSTTGTTGTGAAGSGGGTTTTSTTTTSTGDPLLACLAACPMNVGMCNAAGVCVITCNGSLACPTTVTCPAGIPCEVQCGGMQSCAAGVACGAASACTVACTGDHACTGTVQKPTAVSCPGGGCDVLCTGKDSAELALDCNAGPCTLECSMGLRACETVNCDGDCTIACAAQRLPLPQLHRRAVQRRVQRDAELRSAQLRRRLRVRCEMRRPGQELLLRSGVPEGHGGPRPVQPQAWLYERRRRVRRVQSVTARGAAPRRAMPLEARSAQNDAWNTGTRTSVPCPTP
ncbi:MAG: hypothetical protein R3F14_35640 [Polyangiaceae bacterium]